MAVAVLNTEDVVSRWISFIPVHQRETASSEVTEPCVLRHIRSQKRRFFIVLLTKSDMINTDRAATLQAQTVRPGFVHPDYDGYCITRVPGTVAALLDASVGSTLPEDVFTGVDTNVSNVVVLFIDAYGFEQFQETHTNHTFFDRIAHRGRVTPLTSVFPSETPACVPTFHTGLQPVEHGQLGWNLYLPERDLVVESLPYRTKSGGSIDPAENPLFAGEPIYPQLEAADIDTHVIEPFDSSDDPKTAGATTHTYSTPADFAVRLRRVLEQSSAPTYCYGYTSLVDAAGHAEGTRSELHSAELNCLSATLQRELCDCLQTDVAEETLLLFVADHGQIDSNPGENIDILSDPVINQHLRRDRDDFPAISGSGRDLHLFLEDGSVDRVCSRLREQFNTLVLTREEALESDLWGTGDPCQLFTERIGDLVVIPETITMWYSEHQELDLVGDHGGLHPREQLVPFGAVTLDRLAGDDDCAQTNP